MKKLMIAAATAAMVGGAFADDLCGETEVGCLAYDLKISAKTLVPKTMKCKGEMCGNDDCVTYAVLKSKTFNGFLWACEYDCEDYGKMSGFHFALWEKATKTPYWMVPAKDEKGVREVEDFGTEGIVMDRYEKKANKVQFIMDLNTDDSKVGDTTCNDVDQTAKINVKLAGTGTWETKGNYAKSISGSVAGYRNWSVSEKNVKGCADDYARLVEACTDFTSYCEDDGVVSGDDTPIVVYGTFTLKVNSKATKNSTVWTSFVPSYCICK